MAANSFVIDPELLTQAKTYAKQAAEENMEFYNRMGTLIDQLSEAISGMGDALAGGIRNNRIGYQPENFSRRQKRLKENSQRAEALSEMIQTALDQGELTENGLKDALETVRNFLMGLLGFQRSSGAAAPESQTLNATKAVAVSSAALAGTSYPLDREITKTLLDFDEISQNSLDAVSDRDFVAEYLFCAALTMAHLSRLCEDTILYTSEEFGYWEIPDAYSTGSSIMPQKKNPDIPELVRGKTGRVYGHLMGILTVIKGIPLAYNKDLQEDKEGFFDAETALCNSLSIYAAMLERITLNVNAMYKAAGMGYSTATDVADYLAKRGVPFRDAHAVTGKLVRYCIEQGKSLPALSLEEFRAVSPVFGADILQTVTTRASAEGRACVGGSSVGAARAGIASIKKRLKQY